jgi:hypothetical protein
VVTPKVPSSRQVRQAIFDDQTHGHRDDGLRVATAWWGKTGEIGAKVKAAATATMSGIDNVEVARPVTREAAQVMQDAAAEIVAVAATAATGAGPSTIVAGAGDDDRSGQIFDVGDAFGVIREVLARSHCCVLQKAMASPISASEKTPRVKTSRFLCYSFHKVLINKFASSINVGGKLLADCYQQLYGCLVCPRAVQSVGRCDWRLEQHPSNLPRWSRPKRARSSFLLLTARTRTVRRSGVLSVAVAVPVLPADEFAEDTGADHLPEGMLGEVGVGGLSRASAKARVSSTG